MAAKKKDAKDNAREDAPGAVPGHGGDGAEVPEDQVRVIERAAAIDVARGSGMVCTRVPGPGRIAGGRGCGRWQPPTGR